MEGMRGGDDSGDISEADPGLEDPQAEWTWGMRAGRGLKNLEVSSWSNRRTTGLEKTAMAPPQSVRSPQDIQGR